MNHRLALAVLVAAAGTASAQCNVSKYGVPDFDQRRGYLPNSGSMYCVPTGVLNWMGYIANRGRPAAMGHSSSDWSSSSEYGTVNVRDFNMGDWMDTSDTGGTDTGDAVDGTVEYLNHYNVGPFMVMGLIGNDGWQVTPKGMYSFLKMGHLVSMVYGRYEKDGDQWERTGGHCVTLVSVQDGCNISQCSIGFKDPWTGDSDSISTQSEFATKWWDVSKQTRNYDGDVFPMWGPQGQASGPNDTIRLIDKMIVILPMFVLAKDPLHIDQMIVHAAPLLSNNEDPPQLNVIMPSNAALLHAFPDPHSPSSIIITAPAGGVPAKVWDYDPVDKTFTSLLDLPANPGAFTIDRRGDLLLEINGDLHKFHRLSDGAVIAISYLKLGLPVSSMAFDDATDDLYVLSGPQRRLLRFPGGNIEAVPYSGPLPTAIPVGIVPCIAPSPEDGKIWFCSDASPIVYQLTPSGAAPGWLVTNSVNTGGGSQPTGLQFGDHGEMKFISGNKIHEYDIDPASGRYVPSGDPHFENLPASKFLSLSRSRTNFDPRLHTGPAWANIVDPDPKTPEVPDCLADFNVDGFVNGIDFDEYVALFEAGRPGADVDGDTFVSGIDFDLYMDHFIAGC